MPSHTADRAVARVRSKALNKACQYYKAGDLETFYETLAVLTFRHSSVSVTLANPALPDCPLVGVSQGFERMTGWTRSEIIGRNCRFLNRGCPMPAETRHCLRIACKSHRRFTCILMNRRRTGEVFSNLLHLSSLRIGSTMYVLGIQADVTNSDVDLQQRNHVQELDNLVDAIFAANVDAWALLQVTNFGAAKLGTFLPYTETQLVGRYHPDTLNEAKTTFVALAPGDARESTRLCYTNTFLEVCSEEDAGVSLQQCLRRISSEPILGASGKDDAGQGRLPLKTLREALEQLQIRQPPPPSRARNKQEQDEKEPDPPQSKGSLLHPTGCTPCAFFCYSLMGCKRGQFCEFCHMDHPRKTRARGKRKHKGLHGGHDDAAEEHDELEDHEDVGPAEDGCDPSLCGDELPEPPSSARGSDFARTGQGVMQGSLSDSPSLQACLDPTPEHLLPLLSALALLAPLPAIAFDPNVATGHFPLWLTERRTSTGAGDSVKAEVLPAEATGKPTLRYSESSIVIAKSQWKQVIPFVGGLHGPWIFRIDPQLPRGLALQRSNGVISGIAIQLTPPEGIMHTVTAEGCAGTACTDIHILVVEEPWSGSSACEEGYFARRAGALLSSATGTSEEEEEE